MAKLNLRTRLHNWWIGKPQGSEVSHIDHLKQNQDVKGLLAALEDSQPKVRWAAMWALGELWSIPSLMELGHRWAIVRKEATEKLGHLNDERILPALIASLNDPAREWSKRSSYTGYETSPVGWAAIKALCKIGNPIAIDPLLRTLHTRAAHPLWEYDDRRLYDCIVAMGEPALEHLLELLMKQDRIISSYVFEALQQFEDPRTLEPLEKFLGIAEDPELRADAIRAINLGSRYEDEQIISILIRQLEREENGRVQVYIVATLTNRRHTFKHKSILPVIVNTLKKAEPKYRQEMIDDINKLGTADAKLALSQYQKETGINLS